MKQVTLPYLNNVFMWRYATALCAQNLGEIPRMPITPRCLVNFVCIPQTRVCFQKKEFPSSSSGNGDVARKVMEISRKKLFIDYSEIIAIIN